MHRKANITVVIPCHNEEKGIELVLKRIPDFIDEVIVVNNNSTDRTGEVARQLGARVIDEPKQGYGAAYKAGLPAAKGDIIVTMDGDGTYPTIAIAYLVDILLEDGLDFVSARRMPIDWTRSWNNIQRFCGNLMLTICTAILFGRAIYDSQSGMWVFRKKILDEITLTSDQMAFSEELKVEAFCHPNIKCREVPVQFKYIERVGNSKLNLWGDGLRNLIFLFKKRFSRI